MKKELAKNFEPTTVEPRLYQTWLDKKYFHTEVDKTKEPFSIIMPPPNITGQLHMGHALDNTMQDILIRYKRMAGYNALWIPGMDHASISTELKVVEKLLAEGLTKEDVGREKFLERAWEWKAEYGDIILNQLQKIGCSCDWDRTRFTLDKGCSDAVLEVFCRLHEKGYIYRGEKIINWCTECQTTISDAEVEHEEKAGHFYHLEYPVVGTEKRLRLATTRPETMLGDTAVAVHPEDERYQDLIGKMCLLPLVGREIPIVADEYVDMEFGTGVVKITPAHDPNDFEVGLRHDLPCITVMHDDGTMNEQALQFQGMDRMDCRKAIVKTLQEEGFLIEIEDHPHAVGCHERCHSVVEPMIKMEWFVKMEEMAKPAIEALHQKDVNFVPERFGKTYLHWLENIRDWCISRKLWWGHRIPAYHCGDCSHITIKKTAPDCCEECQSTNITQDEGVLDTWFSSALWPFSTMGFPEQTEELKHFYPTSTLVTGYDIIFFWVVRMVFSGLEQMGEVPFKDVLIHGLIRDEQGRKFSKSLGNGIDPLEVIDKYGVDPLRLMIVSGNAAGNDMRFYFDKLDNCRNFCNKIWNASKFVMMNFGDSMAIKKPNNLTTADKWILSKVNTLTKDVTETLDKYDLGLAVQKVYDFLWDEFCDWYIEMVKPRLYNVEDETRESALWTLKTVLINGLKLLHPFMPFITEELFLHLQEEEESIMISSFPTYQEEWNFKESEKEVDTMKEAVRQIRNVRAEMNVVPSKKVQVFVVSTDEETLNIFKQSTVFLKTLGSASEIFIQKDMAGIAEDSVSVVVKNATIYMPLAELIDFEKEIERLKKEQTKLKKEIERVVNKLSNQGFVSKAPESVIAEEKAKQEKYETMLEQVEQRLSQLKKS